jgi:hypothetical protein
MTAAELAHELKYLRAKDIEPILALALAEERNRAIDDAAFQAQAWWSDYGEDGTGSQLGEAIRALKTDPAESGRGGK